MKSTTLTIERVNLPIYDPYNNGSFCGIVTDLTELNPGLIASSTAGFVKEHADLGISEVRIPGSPAYGPVSIASIAVPAGTEISRNDILQNIEEPTVFCCVVREPTKTFRGRSSVDKLVQSAESLRMVAKLLGAATLVLFENRSLKTVTLTDQDIPPDYISRVDIDGFTRRPSSYGELASEALDRILCRKQ